MTKIVFFALCLVSISSCTSYTQLYQIESTVPNTNSSFIYNNDTIEIVYNLWADGGKMEFTITNKSDKPIYIDWKRSSFVFNDRKSDYYIDKTTTRTTEAGGSFTLPLYVFNGAEWTKGTGTSSATISNSVMVKPERVTFIPPHATITKRMYKLMSGYAKTTNKRDTIINGQKAKTATFQNLYSWRNFITYSFTESGEKEYYVDNAFNISNIIIMKWSTFHGKAIKQPANGATIWEFPYASPSKFYSTEMPRSEAK